MTKKCHNLRSKTFHLNFCQVRKIGHGATTKVKGALPVLLMTFHSGLCKRKRGINPQIIIALIRNCYYTVNFYPMKITGTGNYEAPAGKTCTIYGKGL